MLGIKIKNSKYLGPKIKTHPKIKGVIYILVNIINVMVVTLLIIFLRKLNLFTAMKSEN
jgi:hypothetical protein